MKKACNKSTDRIKNKAQNGKAHEDVFKFKATRNQKYTMHSKIIKKGK